MSEVKQKTIEQYFQENSVPDDKREKIIIHLTKTIYARNEDVIAWEKESDPAEKTKLETKIEEADASIRKRMTDIIQGKETDLHYDF